MGHLFRKRTVRKLDGSIIDMVDETGPGVIISKGQVVNKEHIDELKRIEEDKAKAAQAPSLQRIVSPEEEAKRAGMPDTSKVVIPSPQSNVPPPSVEPPKKTIEERVGDLEGGISEILKILKNK